MAVDAKHNGPITGQTPSGVSTPTENNDIRHAAAGNLAFLLSLIRSNERLSDEEEAHVRRVIERLEKEARREQMRRLSRGLSNMALALNQRVRALRRAGHNVNVGLYMHPDGHTSFEASLYWPGSKDFSDDANAPTSLASAEPSSSSGGIEPSSIQANLFHQ